MKRFIVATCLLMLAPISLLAHEDHNHEAAVEAAPHGGILRNAGDYKAEIVISGDNLKLYVYDKQLKPFKLEKAELKGHVQFPKQKKEAIRFKKSGDFYATTVKGISKVHRYDMHIDLDIAGKKTVADFGIDNI